MRNQKGVTIVEFLIVLIILGTISFFAFMGFRYNVLLARLDPFKSVFGVMLPLTYEDRDRKLSDIEKQLLRPLVALRLQELCDERKSESSTDSMVIQRQLNDLTNRLAKCREAQDIAKSEDLLPE